MPEFDLAAELERLTKLGYAPQILYDDNGYFAVSGDGMSKIRETTDSDYRTVDFAEGSWFKDTPQKAWENYLARLRGDGEKV